MVIKPWSAALAGLILLLLAAPLQAKPVIIAQENSVYHTIYVYEEGGMRCMRFSMTLPGRQSCLDLAHPERLALEYARNILAAFFVQPQPRHILMIGLGGGSLPMAMAQLFPEAEIDSVEIDPAVAKVAENYFFFKPGPRQRVTIEDGRYFIRRASLAGKRYDAILVDAFDKNYIPEHLLTREFLQEVKDILNPGGVIAANTASSGALYSYESATYKAVFGTFFNLRGRGRIIVAARDGLPAMESVAKNATALAPALQSLGADKNAMLELFSTTQDWPGDTPLLTDQYAPANLLNGRTP